MFACYQFASCLEKKHVCLLPVCQLLGEEACLPATSLQAARRRSMFACYQFACCWEKKHVCLLPVCQLLGEEACLPATSLPVARRRSMFACYQFAHCSRVPAADGFSCLVACIQDGLGVYILKMHGIMCYFMRL